MKEDPPKLRLKRAGNWVKDVITGFELAKAGMEEEGLLTDETTFEELSHYAGSHVRLVVKDEEEKIETGESFMDLYWKYREREKNKDENSD